MHRFLVYRSLNFDADYTHVTTTTIYSQETDTCIISESSLMPLSSQMLLPEATVALISTIYSTIDAIIKRDSLLCLSSFCST